MSKKNKAQVEMVETVETKKLGRPVNPNSERQKRLAEKQALIENGVQIKRGRPVVEGSKNQEKMARRAELAQAGLLTGKRGRPSNPESKRQKRLVELEMKRANGTLKLGRPKKVVEAETEVEA